MKVVETVNIGQGHKIEFGNSSWDNTEESVRNRYPTAKGGFSPHSSSEIPLRDIPLIVIECLKKDKIKKVDVLNILEELTNFFKKQI